jgi:hypothetical protein
MKLDAFEIQRREIQIAIKQQLQEGKVVILSGNNSESSRIYNSEPEKFGKMKLEDGTTAFFLKK